jgi:colanic acid/amylovoran biosynthesis glycosyltransferase
MKVVMVVPTFPKLSESFIVSKFLGLLARGVDVHLICWRSEPEEWGRSLQLKGRRRLRRRVHVAWPSRPHWLALLLIPAALMRCLLRNPRGTLSYLRQGWRRHGFDALRRFYLDAEFVSLKADLIHFEFGPLAVGRIGLKESLGGKIVVSFRGYDLNYVGLEEADYYQAIWDGADALHLLGEDLWRRALRRGCPPAKRHVLIPPAIDTAFFDPGDRNPLDVAGKRERPLRILSLGRLEWKKGYEYALQAVRLLMDQGVCCEYRIIGDGEYLEPVALARHQLGLEAAVQFLGARPHGEVKAQALWADVFLHAAVSEGFCNAVLEAQAMRLPVVCTDADGLAENVLDGVTGWVVARRNPEALAEKLAVLARDPALRERMAGAGRQRVVTQFQLADQIAAFEALYREVLERPESAATLSSREVSGIPA